MLFAKSQFFENYNAITNHLPFDPEWALTSELFEGIINLDLGLEPGSVIGTVDPTGRKLIIVVTRAGNAIFYPRYPDVPLGTTVDILSNVPSALEGICPKGPISGHLLARLSHVECNIGKIVEDLITTLSKEGIL